MSFVVSSSDLQRHLATVAGVVPAKSVLPIIQNIHFVVDGSQLILSATDLENAVKTSLAIENSGNVKLDLALNARILQDTLKALPEQPLTFSFNEESQTVTIQSDFGEYKIVSNNGLDFPSTPKSENTSTMMIPTKILARALDKTAFAASTDEFKTNMNGVFFDFKANSATFVATDAHRLVRYRRTDLSIENEISFIVPLKALKILSQALATTDKEVITIEYNNRHAFFQFGNTELICRLVDANFPPYDAVIPKSSSNKAILNRKDLAGSLKRVEIYANRTHHMGMFTLVGNVLTVQAEDKESATKAKENLHCLYEGNELKIGFDVRLMIDIIAKMETDDVIIELDTPGRAAVFTPSVPETNEDTLMLLMPVMLGVYYS